MSIKYADSVPGILTEALRKIQAGKKASGEPTAPITLVTPRGNPNRMPIRIATAKRKLVARGAGVYEDSESGDIWFREGEYLVRQAVDTNKIVENYLRSVEGK